MTRFQRAHAKVNLGLEILGRRQDGYHEVRTVLSAISLGDDLTFEDADEDELVLRGIDVDLPPEENLVVRALRAMRERGAAIPPQRIGLTKRIPAAAGLGGASSDAAATIRAFQPELRDAGVDPQAIAASLGSDLPFFLDGPTALASGRGERLTPLPVPESAWAVLVTPEIAIPDKTRTMYGAVDPSWWSDGSTVEAIASALPALPAAAPRNVFERALLARYPEMERVRSTLPAAGAPFAAMSGAGPTFYTLVESDRQARAIAERVAGTRLTVHVATLIRAADG